jgi:hypothetical protein
MDSMIRDSIFGLYHGSGGADDKVHDADGNFVGGAGAATSSTTTVKSSTAAASAISSSTHTNSPLIKPSFIDKALFFQV